MPSRKCPDGTICIENATMGFICIFAISAMYAVAKITLASSSASSSNGPAMRLQVNHSGHTGGYHSHQLAARMSWPYTNIPSEAARMFGFAPGPLTFNEPARH